jgi:hypothetical protein
MGLITGCQATGVSSAPAVVSASTSATTSSAGVVIISPSSQTISPSASLQYSATGGTPPYTYSVASGGGSISSTTGLYMAPSAGATVEIAVEDSVGNYSYASLTISSSAILLSAASGGVNTASGTDQMTASGGTPPYTYSVTGCALTTGCGTIDPNAGIYTAPATLPATTTSVEIQAEDNVGSIAYTVINVGANATSTSTGTTTGTTTGTSLIYFGEAASNNPLAGWPASNVLADNGVSCFSSGGYATSTPSVSPYLAAYFAGPTTIHQINLAARMLNGVPLAFPLAYQVYVSDPTNTYWISIGNYTTQPTSTGGLAITLSQSVSTYGFLIVASQLGMDNLGGIYFQLCGLSAQ